MSVNENNGKIEVLLATFQGETWLAEQIASILSQSYPEVEILARDDGSRDATPALLAAAAAEHQDRLRVLSTESSTGSAGGNFARLLRASTAQYAAFADQDDVWSADKLSRTMAEMRALEAKHGKDLPLLVFSDLRVVDEGLQTIEASLWANNSLNPATVTRLPRLLSENVVTGCTALLNRPMIELAKRMPAGKTKQAGTDALVLMHDHWVALLACTLGRAAWIQTPTVLYRQHGGNVVGAAQMELSLSGRLTRLLGRSAAENRTLVRQQLQQQAAAFLICYDEELGEENRQILRAYSTLDCSAGLSRLAKTVRWGFWRNSVSRNLVTFLDTLRS